MSNVIDFSSRKPVIQEEVKETTKLSREDLYGYFKDFEYTLDKKTKGELIGFAVIAVIKHDDTTGTTYYRIAAEDQHKDQIINDFQDVIRSALQQRK